MSQLPFDDDLAALLAVAEHGGALCTVVGIDGSWSRRLGAQLAVLPDGRMVGSLADGCLERALAHQAQEGGEARVLRYGAGSPFMDIRLPCGSGVEVMVDPAPDKTLLQGAVDALARREAADLPVTADFTRRYLPRLRLLVLGSGPEASALVDMAQRQGVEVLLASPHGEGGEASLSLGQDPRLAAPWQPDPWTACAILFHDHEWERCLIPWALRTPAFYVGAQGGAKTRANRLEHLGAVGFGAEALAKLRSPIGLIPAARTPSVLALSVLAEVVGEYERLVG
jgi:xanthine dehydrogenase accessory factor